MVNSFKQTLICYLVFYKTPFPGSSMCMTKIIKSVLSCNKKPDNSIKLLIDLEFPQKNCVQIMNLAFAQNIKTQMDANSLLMNRFRMQSKKRLVKEMIYSVQASKDVKLSNLGKASEIHHGLKKLQATCPGKDPFPVHYIQPLSWYSILHQPFSDDQYFLVHQPGDLQPERYLLPDFRTLAR
jgi:hypothetical protein